PSFDPGIFEYTLAEVPYETESLTYTVSTTFDTAGYLECSHCDWWQYESRGEQFLTLNSGLNRIDWRFNPGVPGVPDRHYYVEVVRGSPFSGEHFTELTLSNSELTEVRGQGLYIFDASGVARVTDSTDLTATFAAGTATWSVNESEPVALVSGVASSIPLINGNNVITVVHTVDNEDTVHTIRIRRGGVFTDLEFFLDGTRTESVPLSPTFDKDIMVYSLPDQPIEQTTLHFRVETSDDEPGFLDATQADWWLYESRNQQDLKVTLNEGHNCIEFRSRPQVGQADLSIVSYYVSVNRGDVSNPPPCPNL
ncbi:MAG: hypothetical protein KC561_21135, partial [Myxococcales bacterium]|nr:hypothetical protein [Myxococcales bacterium]